MLVYEYSPGFFSDNVAGQKVVKIHIISHANAADGSILIALKHNPS